MFEGKIVLSLLLVMTFAKPPYSKEKTINSNIK
jgi:hypothetical protein